MTRRTGRKSRPCLTENSGNGKIVLDAGAFDCDGDGEIDPNLISGHGGLKNGSEFGQMIRDAIQRIKDARSGGIL